MVSGDIYQREHFIPQLKLDVIEKRVQPIKLNMTVDGGKALTRLFFIRLVTTLGLLDVFGGEGHLCDNLQIVSSKSRRNHQPDQLWKCKGNILQLISIFENHQS